MDGWAGYRLATKTKSLRIKIKEWAKINFADIKMQKVQLLKDIQNLDKEEEVGCFTGEEVVKRMSLKEEFQRKLRKEEIMWRHRSRCKWLKEGDKNTKFFRWMASSRKRKNRISSLVDGDRSLDGKEEIINHMEEYFASLYSKDRWKRR